MSVISLPVALGKLESIHCLNKLKQLAQNDASALVREGAQNSSRTDRIACRQRRSLNGKN